MVLIVAVDLFSQSDDARLNQSHGNDDLRHVVDVVLFCFKERRIMSIVYPHHLVVLKCASELFILLFFNQRRI